MPANLVGMALYYGVSGDPERENNPYLGGTRQLASDDGQRGIEISRGGGDYEMLVIRFGGGFPNVSGIGGFDSVRVKALVVGNEIVGVNANSQMYEGPRLDIFNGNLPLDRVVGTWTNGEYSVKLVLTSIAEQPDVMRVCWDAHLPPPRPVTGPPGYEAPPHLARTEPFKVLMCSLYGRYTRSSDLGGYVIEEREGQHYTMRGYW